MKQQLDNCIELLKTKLDVEGCITGSALLGYFPDSKQDIDLFVYSEKAFTKTIYTLFHNPLFTILDKKELWKFSDWCDSPYSGSIKKLGLVSLKFVYNLCIEVNVIFKDKNHSIFDVLSSFDMDIICKGYDLKTKQVLDLTDGSTETKVASWNKWNKSFYNANIWSISRILRQFYRVHKYYLRGYQTDGMVHKYKEMLIDMLEYENIFSSEKVDEKVLSVKTNGKILIQILDKWLETHELSELEIELINQTIKNL